jgi:hypothetical protein
MEKVKIKLEITKEIRYCERYLELKKEFENYEKEI